HHRPLAAHAAATQPKGSADMGADDAAGKRLASDTDHPPSLAKHTLRRHTPEVGAVCGKAARTVLCGGRSVMGVPTASLVARVPPAPPPDGSGFTRLRMPFAMLLRTRARSSWRPRWLRARSFARAVCFVPQVFAPVGSQTRSAGGAARAAPSRV